MIQGQTLDFQLPVARHVFLHHFPLSRAAFLPLTRERRNDAGKLLSAANPAGLHNPEHNSFRSEACDSLGKAINYC